MRWSSLEWIFRIISISSLTQFQRVKPFNSIFLIWFWWGGFCCLFCWFFWSNLSVLTPVCFQWIINLNIPYKYTSRYCLEIPEPTSACLWAFCDFTRLFYLQNFDSRRYRSCKHVLLDPSWQPTAELSLPEVLSAEIPAHTFCRRHWAWSTSGSCSAGLLKLSWVGGPSAAPACTAWTALVLAQHDLLPSLQGLLCAADNKGGVAVEEKDHLLQLLKAKSSSWVLAKATSQMVKKWLWW